MTKKKDECGSETQRRVSGHDGDGGSSADGAVAVSLKFHLVQLVHVEHPLGRLDRALGLLRVRKLRCSRRPEDNWSI